MKGPGFNLFNRLSGTISIEMSEPPHRMGQLWNMQSPPTATLKDVTWPNPSIYEKDNYDDPFRPLTSEELDLVVLETPSIRVNSFACLKRTRNVEHKAPNGKYFTIRDMLGVVVETERQTRGDTDWFGGIDVHHVFFEGIKLRDDGVWIIGWGS
jgi:hypothetical protein